MTMAETFGDGTLAGGAIGCWQGIVPPYMLEHIASTGTNGERAAASAALARVEVLHEARRTAPSAAVTEATPALTPTATVAIYTAAGKETLPGTLVRGDTAPASGDVAVDEAHDGLRATLTLYGEVFDRDSVDGKGLDLIGTVHYGTGYDNAEWTGSQMLFGDGDGTLFNRFTIAVDVMGHELTHGVTQYSAALDYQDQAGALNESVSDVFGSMVKQHAADPQQTSAEADWLIGAGLLAAGVNGVALRSMKAPGTAYDDPRLGKDPQPATMAGYVSGTADNGGVHTNSGIPNHAFYLVATALGGYAWQQAGPIWYDVLTGGTCPSSATFAQFAQLTIDSATRLFGTQVAGSVKDAWDQVGVTTAGATTTG
jgi:Zn-dependent metalloprotease